MFLVSFSDYKMKMTKLFFQTNKGDQIVEGNTDPAAFLFMFMVGEVNRVPCVRTKKRGHISE